MPRMSNCHCASCDKTFERICEPHEIVVCECGAACEQRWWERSSNRGGEWHPSETAVVFKKADGTYSFPARADKPTPAGCERIEIRSDRQMAAIEKAANVRSERRWYDSGSGRGFDDHLPKAGR